MATAFATFYSFQKNYLLFRFVIIYLFTFEKVT